MSKKDFDPCVGCLNCELSCTVKIHGNCPDFLFGVKVNENITAKA